MRLSAKERTALRAMAELARRYGHGPTPLAEVAHAEGLPLPYLERVAADLRQAGLIESVRGAHGGYALARPPAEVTLADVMRAVEGSLLPLDCMRDDGAPCLRESSCASRNVWRLVADRLKETLDRTTLADLSSSGQP
ncbi:MAG: Rrf2 family transcriptional regulator [Chloroflexota bacterium]